MADAAGLQSDTSAAQDSSLLHTDKHSYSKKGRVTPKLNFHPFTTEDNRRLCGLEKYQHISIYVVKWVEFTIYMNSPFSINLRTQTLVFLPPLCV